MLILHSTSAVAVNAEMKNNLNGRNNWFDKSGGSAFWMSALVCTTASGWHSADCLCRTDINHQCDLFVLRCTRCTRPAVQYCLKQWQKLAVGQKYQYWTDIIVILPLAIRYRYTGTKYQISLLKHAGVSYGRTIFVRIRRYETTLKQIPPPPH